MWPIIMCCAELANSIFCSIKQLNVDYCSPPNMTSKSDPSLARISVILRF